mmetsp:Transcript_30584/g.88245  ORF Transcript_30584/g.88245 Transcript_30584/m.88245 type:complete len:224 (+) Transcript_30584:1023-1694(+)
MSGLDTAAVIATVLATVLAAAAACAAKADGFPPLHRVRGCGDDAFRDVNLAGNLRDFRTQSRRAHHLARQLRHDPGSEGLRRNRRWGGRRAAEGRWGCRGPSRRHSGHANVGTHGAVTTKRRVAEGRRGDRAPCSRHDGLRNAGQPLARWHGRRWQRRRQPIRRCRDRRAHRELVRGCLLADPPRELLRNAPPQHVKRLLQPAGKHFVVAEAAGHDPRARQLQ